MNRIRNVAFDIKAGKSAEFNKVLTNEVLPLMKQQPGFKHELAMVNGSHVEALSVWQDQGSVDKYNTTIYPEVLKKLSPVIDGTPKVTNYDLVGTTLSV